MATSGEDEVVAAHHSAAAEEPDCEPPESSEPPFQEPRESENTDGPSDTTTKSSDTTSKSSKKSRHKDKNAIPNHIENQIKDLPEVKNYLLSLQKKLKSKKKEISSLKDKLSSLEKKKSKSRKADEAPVSIDGEDLISISARAARYAAAQTCSRPIKVSPERPKTPPAPQKSSAVKEEPAATAWGAEEGGLSLAEQVKQAAESVLQESGFVFHESLGLYYDNATGYYYDPNSSLYYDGINKTYYTYDESTQLFHVYHQMQQEEEKNQEEQEIVNWEKGLKKRKKEIKKTVKKRRPRKHSESEEEEGECSESSSSEDEKDKKRRLHAEHKARVEEKLPKCTDPSLRMMVLETQLPKLKIGTLFLVTVTGGTLGREGDTHAVCIPDINVSKHHARFTYEKGKYLVRDLGSRNGTYVDGERLSVALRESEDCELQHGSELRLGCTLLSCHMHPGSETCGHCEPGLVQSRGKVPSSHLRHLYSVLCPVAAEAGPTQTTAAAEEGKEAKHKQELMRLRKKFALTGLPPDDPKALLEKQGYHDRADSRRQTVGSQHHGAKTESASMEESVPESNKGFKMLAKMGWKTGESLGKDNTGCKEPISLQVRAPKSGLGAEQGPAPVQVGFAEKQRQKAWAQARSRFSQLAAAPAFQEEDSD